MTMITINWDFIDKVIYINLNRRKDRRLYLSRELKKLGIPKDKICRLEAIEYSPGYIGCAMSHLHALHMADKEGWKNVLILEDDIAFHHDDDAYQRINKYFKALNHVNWNVGFLAANYQNVTQLGSVDYIVKANKAWCACAYIVNQNYYQQLQHVYTQSINALLQGGQQHEYALDVYWHESMLRDCWLGIFPNVGYQQPDKSDIEGQYVDYRGLFAKPLNEITQRQVKKRIGNQKIKVDILFQWSPGWTNFETVIDALRNDDKFDCRIIVIPFTSEGSTDPTNMAAREFLDECEVPYYGYENYNLYERKPDVVFLQNPYDVNRPSIFSCANLIRNGIKIAYIPYGLDMGASELNTNFQYNMACHNSASWIFVRSQRHKNEFALHCAAGKDHVHVVGHPKFDHYHERYCSTEKTVFTNNLKTLLWAPQYIIENDPRWSTFDLYAHAIMDIIDQGKVNVIIRPHPLFIQWVNHFGDKVKEQYAQLLAFTQNRSNVIWDFGADYKMAYSQSDALMADVGSFLLEYLPSRKPILLLTHEKRLGINNSASFIYHDYDVAWSEKDLYTFVSNVISGNDVKQKERLAALSRELYFAPQGAGHAIIEIIKKSFSLESE
ncbi:glycosyltransferase family 25 protein [Cedecea sp. S5-13]|uniref:glycosyltransferase family 25 protein n=1 Tax=Cedecea selenatireducens TaxID=3144416 RepID=UPI0035CD31BB